MSPEFPRAVGEALERLLFLAVLFTVLWVKGDLWWAFGLAAVAYLVSSVRVAPPPEPEGEAEAVELREPEPTGDEGRDAGV